MGSSGGGEIDGEECVPKWDLLKVSEVHEVKCTLQVKSWWKVFAVAAVEAVGCVTVQRLRGAMGGWPSGSQKLCVQMSYQLTAVTQPSGVLHYLYSFKM